MWVNRNCRTLIKCQACERERFQLSQALRYLEINDLSLQVLLGDGPKQSRIYRELVIYLKETGLINRIWDSGFSLRFLFLWVIYLFIYLNK